MRTCNYIGNPPMFHSRVSGVGITTQTAEDIQKEAERRARITPALQEYQRKMSVWNAGVAAARSKCPPIDPNIRTIAPIVCQPVVDYTRVNPQPTPPEGATKWDLVWAQTLPPVDERTRLQVCPPVCPEGYVPPEKKVDDAKAWRSNTPIFSWTATSPLGDPRTVKVYGYNKELKAVWLAEGPNASAENSMLISEEVLASKSPEWVAWKSSSGSTASALPLLLGAAFLLLS